MGNELLAPCTSSQHLSFQLERDWVMGRSSRLGHRSSSTGLGWMALASCLACAGSLSLQAEAGHFGSHSNKVSGGTVRPATVKMTLCLLFWSSRAAEVAAPRPQSRWEQRHWVLLGSCRPGCAHPEGNMLVSEEPAGPRPRELGTELTQGH